MNIKEATYSCFRKYFIISGRATRSEFFWFSLVSPLIILLVSALPVITPLPANYAALLIYAAIIILFIPNITVLVRRLHDLGYSGSAGFIYYLVIQLFSAIRPLADSNGIHIAKNPAIDNLLTSVVAGLCVIPIFILAQRGSVGPNKYGPDPLETHPDPIHWKREM